MNAIERQEQIINILNENYESISGTDLAKRLSVSRQIIVTDIAILRAKGFDITSTTKGYVLASEKVCQRIFKVHHDKEACEEELSIFTDYGAVIVDEFISHKAYGLIRAELDLRSRIDVKEFLERVDESKGMLLSSMTGGYHYHTIIAPSVEVLDKIENKLWEKGFLAKMLEYEPEVFAKDLSNRQNK